VGAHEGHGGRRSRRPTGRTRARVDHTQPGGASKRKTRRDYARGWLFSPLCYFFFRLRGWAAGLRCGVVGKFSEEVRVHIRGLAVAARRLVRGCVTWEESGWGWRRWDPTAVMG
jgi:hypothetical protein